jgi:hypothetical protein
MQRIGMTFLVVLLTLAVGCADDRPTEPSGSGRQFLAGGGRQSDGDSLAGGPVDSGPGRPGFDLPNPEYIPLFYSDIDCQETPTLSVIATQDAWQAWWSAAIACIGSDGDDPTVPPEEGVFHPWKHVAGDSGVVSPDGSGYAYPPEAPEVDFSQSTVITISLESDSTAGRGVWVQEVASGETGTTVRYEVSHLGEDCNNLIIAPWPSPPTSPTVAVMVPLVVTEPVTWQREDVTFDCTWEPDPNEPLTLYYTDAECDLGPDEAVITDQASFDAWFEAALSCDEARWYDRGSPGTSGDSCSTPPLPATWVGIEVDFTTHAVLVLRADSQDRWGGGIWLEGIHVSNSGTTIDYVVMTPGDDCPVIGEKGAVRPTVAIRVPLPISAPVTWNRHVETIDCAWQVLPEDSVNVSGTRH